MGPRKIDFGYDRNRAGLLTFQLVMTMKNPVTQTSTSAPRPKALRKLLPALFIMILMLAGLGCAEAADAIKPRPKDAADDRGRIYSDRCIVLGPKAHSPGARCVYGKRNSNRKVVLFGDSHALQWGPTMIRLANEKGWRLTALIRQGCPVAQVKFERWCDNWRHNTMRRIVRRERPGLVVVSTATTGRYKVKDGSETLSRDESQSHLVEGMKKTLQRLRNMGARVIVIRDQHLAPSGTPTCVRRNIKRPNRNCSFRPDDRRDRQDFDYRAARQVKQVRVLDPVPVFCPKRPCQVVNNGLLMYRDGYHITATYARSLAPWLGRKLPTPRSR